MDNKFDRDRLRGLCWGLLFHTLGLPERSDKILKNLKNGMKNGNPDKKIVCLAKLIIKYNEAVGQEIIKETSASIVESLGGLLDPISYGASSPNLSKECKRCLRNSNSGANDSPKGGYSRDPLLKIDKKHKPEIGLAAILYILRAHVWFFTMPRSKRDFNAAKVALNDLFQASQLASRLYHSLECSHTALMSKLFKSFNSSQDAGQKKYFEEVKKGCNNDDRYPWESAFFIWCLNQMVEIQRGNIYRHINYLNESDRHYKHAQDRFDRFAGNHPLKVNEEAIVDLENDLLFITPTLIRAFFERSKVLLDLGFFIESIMNQLRCLAYLVRIIDRENTKENELLKNLSTVLGFFDAVRRQSNWDKKSIIQLFDSNCEENHGSFKAIQPDRFVNHLKKNYNPEDREHQRLLKLATEIFARLGFSLFSFLGSSSSTELLQKFFVIGDDLDVDIPPLARYCQTIIEKPASEIPVRPREEPDSTDSLVFLDSLERDLAYILRGNNVSSGDAQSDLSEKNFYSEMIEVETLNIDNVVTIPRRLEGFLMRSGYFMRRSPGQGNKETVFELFKYLQGKRQEPARDDPKKREIASKLVILRRWQSFNPKIPRPPSTNIRGGGCFLIWQGKGIVIDPGYDFIRNFYEEGFSLADIDAVIVTHSHPDHDDDLSTLSTLINEWNKYYERKGYSKENHCKIDLFLNESTHLKFSAWLNASGAGIGRIVSLPLVVWDSKSKGKEESIRGKNVFFRLRDKYLFDLEVIPAWHDDVIGKTASIGLKFHLFTDPEQDKKKRLGVVGYTGDTGLYELPIHYDKNATSRGNIESQYQDCDVLVAHLGDIRLRELSLSMKDQEGNHVLKSSIYTLFKKKFCVNGEVHDKKVTPEAVNDFLSLLISLNIIPDSALNTSFDNSFTFIEAVNKFINKDLGESRLPPLGLNDYEEKGGLVKRFTPNTNIESEKKSFSKAFYQYLGHIPVFEGNNYEYEWQKISAIIGFFCASSEINWNYEYHLGISGIYKLHRAMVEDAKKEMKERKRIFVVAELPEELSSYRHYVARLLNKTKDNVVNKDEKKHKVYSFTGDIGLHIRLATFNSREYMWDPKIRCTYCNHNNEAALKKNNYHSPDMVHETPLKRLDSAMIYLCTEHDHHPAEKDNERLEFLSRPVLRVIS